MNIFHSIVLKISTVFTTFLVLVGLSSAPVEIPAEPTPTIAPVEIVEITSVESVPVVKKEITPTQTVVEETTPLSGNSIVPETVLTPETRTVILQIMEEEKPKKPDNIFQEQEDTSMAKVEKTYSVTPQEGSPLKSRKNLSLEELREYVLQTNYQVLSFRKQMKVASAKELIAYLEQNGFTVEIK